LAGLRPGFFKRGVMDESFSRDGMDPDMREVLKGYSLFFGNRLILPLPQS